MSKRTYPLTAASAMGSSGMRCPQIIEDPIDRRIPVKVELAEGYYILHYADPMEEYFLSRRDDLFSLPTRDRPKSLLLSRDMELWILASKYSQSAIPDIYNIASEERRTLWGIPYNVRFYGKDPAAAITFCYPNHLWARFDGRDFKIPEDIEASKRDWSSVDPRPMVSGFGIIADVSRFNSIGIDPAKPGSERTVFTVTNPGNDESLYAKFEDEARGAISRSFKIPESISAGRVENSSIERVYDASAWTGRKTSKPSRDLSLAEAWAEFEAAIEEEFSKSWIFRYLRTFVAMEYYYDDDRVLRVRKRIIPALGIANRAAIKRSIRLRNGVLKVDNAFRSIGKAIRNAVRAQIRFNSKLKGGQ